MDLNARIIALAADMGLIEFGFKSGVTKSGLAWTIRTGVDGVGTHYPKSMSVTDVATRASLSWKKDAPRHAMIGLLRTPEATHGTMASSRGIKAVLDPVAENFKKRKITATYQPAPQSRNPRAVRDAQVLDRHYRRMAKLKGFKVDDSGVFTRLVP